ncbi:MAG: hypothetical protein ACRDQA_26520, partial [Nocardioidaceae bacterium]
MRKPQCPLPGRGGSTAAVRLLANLPAIAASAVLVCLAASWLDGMTIIVVTMWLLLGVLGFSRLVERSLARLRRFHRLDLASAGPLAPLLSHALGTCRLRPGSVDWYVVPGESQINAYAMGSHGVGVTGGFASAHLGGRLGHRRALAILVHELGHHACRATRYGYPLSWWTLPWRLATHAVAKP